MRGLDLKKFKKVSTDEKSTTFKHDDGHTIKIAHSKLSKDMQKKLDALPHYKEGGEVSPEDAAAKEKAYNAEKIKEYSANPQPGSHAPVDEPISEQEAADRIAQQYPNTEAPKYNMTGQVVPSSNSMDSAGFAQEAQADQSTNPTPVAQSAPPMPADNSPYAGPAVTKAPVAPQANNDLLGNYANAYGKGIAEQKTGIQGTAGVQQGAEAQTAHELQNMSQFEHGQPGGFGDILQNTISQAMDQREKFRQDIINNHIDPDRIFKNMDTGAKISTGIGLLLGGLGSGLAHQPNLAYDFLIKQRDADLAAQEKNLDSYQGIYYHNFQDLGDRTAALAMSKVNMNDALAHKLGAIAATAKSQDAKNAALTAIGKIDQDTAFWQSQAIQSKAQSTAQGGQPVDNTPNVINAMEFINPALAKTMKEKYVPGVGMAAVPVPDKERGEITTRQDLQNKISQLRDFAQKNQGSLNPAIINQGNAMANLVQDAYRQAAGQGVFKPAEKEFVNNIISEHPTAFFNKFRTDPGYKAIQDSNSQSLNSLYRNYGLRPQGGVSLGTSQEGWKPKTFRPKE